MPYIPLLQPDGWAVIDEVAGTPAMLGNIRQVGLRETEARAVANCLNGFNAAAASRPQQVPGQRECDLLTSEGIALAPSAREPSKSL